MAMQILWMGFFEKAWQWLDDVDRALFLKVNTVYTNSFLDGAFPVWREATTWIPLYFFIILFISINYKSKAIPYILFLILTITISDQISSGFLKNWINRSRPCNDPFVQLKMRLLLNRCPSSGSFTSSHATNHFAVAMFLWITLKPIIRKWGKLLFVWAATICYGQLYVGVHYPLDILGGCLLGCLIGFGSASLFNQKIGIPHLKSQNLAV